MAKVKKRGDYSVIEFVGGFLSLGVGFSLILGTESGSLAGGVGLLLIPVGIVLLVLAFIQYGRNVRAVANVVMGAAVKINNQPVRSGSVADEINRLTSMHSAGTLTDAEFAAAKAKALG